MAWPLVWPGVGDRRLASPVAAALAASSLGRLLPWLLARIGSDPAHGSGPLATIVRDVRSLAICLALAALLLG